MPGDYVERMKKLKYCGDPTRKDGEKCKVDVLVVEYQGITEEVEVFGLPGPFRLAARAAKAKYADDLESEDAIIREMQMEMK